MDSVSLSNQGLTARDSLRPVRRLRLVLASLFGAPVALLSVSVSLLGVAGCKSDSPPPALAATVAPAELAAAPIKAEPAKSTAESDAFSVSLQSTGEQSVGQPGRAQLVLVPKAPFHTNPEYPYKLKLDTNAGLKFASDTVTKEGGQVAPARAVFEVPFTPTAAGTHTLSGLFAFSVCKDDQCLVERQQLALPITVAAAK